MPLEMYQTKQAAGIDQVVHPIAVAAGKGGVGKSTIACNLAAALRSQGAQVGLLDADLYGPSLSAMLPVDDPMRKVGELYEPAICRGMPTASLGYFRDAREANTIRAPIANGIITQLVHQMVWGKLDYLVVDFPPGTGDIPLTLSQQIPFAGAILVTTPQEVALADVRKAVVAFEKVHIPLLGIVENMSYFKVDKKRLYPLGRGGGERLAHEFQVPLFAQIPLQEELSQWSDEGRLATLTDPKHAISSLFFSIADQLKVRLGEQRRFVPTTIENRASSLFLAWPDDRAQSIDYAALQRRCPCAGCQGKGMAKEDVVAKRLALVGQYALKIDFSTGCSNGIYALDSLYHW